MHDRFLNELQKHDMQHLKALQRRKGKRRRPYKVLYWFPLLMILPIAVLIFLTIK
jgi:hypothetical protein